MNSIFRTFIFRTFNRNDIIENLCVTQYKNQFVIHVFGQDNDEIELLNFNYNNLRQLYQTCKDLCNLSYKEIIDKYKISKVNRRIILRLNNEWSEIYKEDVENFKRFNEIVDYMTYDYINGQNPIDFTNDYLINKNKYIQKYIFSGGYLNE